jgi:hypothetical protein
MKVPFLRPRYRGGRRERVVEVDGRARRHAQIVSILLRDEKGFVRVRSAPTIDSGGVPA